jgi:predicted nuclease with TOPRIM domain
MKDEMPIGEVIHKITYAEEPQQPQEEVSHILDGVDLDDTRAIADHYMVKNNTIDSDQLEVEKKEKELFEEIKKVVKNKSTLAEYLTNLHASIEVMEERLYELELKDAKKEKDSLTAMKTPMPSGLSSKGLNQLPFGLF